MLEINNLTHAYPAGRSIKYPNWKIDDNEHALILGNSGSGKTTLLHLIGGLLRPAEGSLSLNGESYGAYSQKELDQWRGTNVGIVFQNAHLVKSLTIRENLDLVFMLNNQKIDVKKREMLIDNLQLNQLVDRMPYQISHGQAQRVSIARALIHSPKMLLADEPTASLDDENAHIVIDLLINQASMFKSILIIATHDHRVKTAFDKTLLL